MISRSERAQCVQNKHPEITLPAPGEGSPGQTLHSPSPKEQKGAGRGQGSPSLLPTGPLQLTRVAQHNQHPAFVFGSSPLFERQAVGRLDCLSALGSSGAGSDMAVEGSGCWLAGHEVAGAARGEAEHGTPWSD